MRYIDAEKLKRYLIYRSFYPSIVKRAIEEAPTEDVVSRSEVEQAKQEVARVIFEEFEKCFDKRFGDWMFIHWKYAELKKKYIGE